MGALTKHISNIADKAWDHVQNLGDKVSGVLSKVTGYVGTAFEVAKNGSTFVGLQYSQIEPIRASIRTYVTNVQTELAKLNTEASNSNALKGESAAAASAYVKAVSDVAQAYATALLAYSDKMYQYGEEYKKNDTTLSQEVKDEASALSSSAEAYTEKY